MNAVRVAVAGWPFVVTPGERLSAAEHQSLQRLDGEALPARPFVVHLDETFPGPPPDAPRDGEPAAISVEGELVVIAHQRLLGTIDPVAFEGKLAREEGADAFALEIMLRTALSCRLPLEGGMLLHSAGIVLDGRAAIFFGVSGSGKSTIAELLGGAILSDELVAIYDGHARSTGFWGSLDRDDCPRGAFPISALVDLDRGPGVRLEPLEPSPALRRILLATVVPPHPMLWTHALRVAAQLAHTPVFRLHWTPSAENAQRVAALLTTRP